MDYARPLIDLRTNRALKDTLERFSWTHDQRTREDDRHLDAQNAEDPKRGSGGTHMEENLVENAMKNMEATKKKTTSTPVSDAFSALGEDNGNFMDDLIDDTWMGSS
nr:hypothetical protein [Tanacetum cinerariifolium]